MKISAVALCRAIRQQGLRPRSYSGRGMYGIECVGVSADSQGEVIDLCVELADHDLGAKLPAPSFDSLGLGVIAYWPRIEWTEGCRSKKGDDE